MKHIVVKLLALIALACSLATTARAESFAKRIDIGGGRMMYIECHGSGSPTVVFDAGHRGRGDYWDVSDPASPKAMPVLAGVQQFTRVCTYDRPGTELGSAPKDFSRSDPVPMPRNAAAAVTDLHELLGAAKVPGPYVLVGHSFGGLDILLYALNYPRSVAGIVFVDALPPELRNQMTPSLWKTYCELNAQPPPGIHYKELETMDFNASMDQVQGALARTTLPAIPIVVLTKDRPFDLAGLGTPAGFGEKLEAAWRRAQQQLAGSIAHVPLTVVETSHNLSVERPDVVIDAIHHVVEAVRSDRKTVIQ
jgi:pimeloyl-ACP methyl ester carboxylesterase